MLITAMKLLSLAFIAVLIFGLSFAKGGKEPKNGKHNIPVLKKQIDAAIEYLDTCEQKLELLKAGLLFEANKVEELTQNLPNGPILLPDDQNKHVKKMKEMLAVAVEAINTAVDGKECEEQFKCYEYLKSPKDWKKLEKNCGVEDLKEVFQKAKDKDKNQDTDKDKDKNMDTNKDKDNVIVKDKVKYMDKDGKEKDSEKDKNKDTDNDIHKEKHMDKDEDEIKDKNEKEKNEL